METYCTVNDWMQLARAGERRGRQPMSALHCTTGPPHPRAPAYEKMPNRMPSRLITKKLVDRCVRSSSRPTNGMLATPTTGSSNENSAVVCAATEPKRSTSAFQPRQPCPAGRLRGLRPRPTLLAVGQPQQLLVQRGDVKVDPEHVHHRRDRKQPAPRPRRTVACASVSRPPVYRETCPWDAPERPRLELPPQRDGAQAAQPAVDHRLGILPPRHLMRIARTR